VPEAYEYIRGIMARLKCPVYYLVGNHDHPEMLQRILLNRSDPKPQLNYEFEVNGVQFIVLDSKVSGSDHPSGYINVDQLAWLDRLCTMPDDRPLVVAVHHNLVKVGIPWLDDFMRAKNGDKVHSVIAKAGRRLRGVFHGHIHQNIDVLRDGVMYVSAASPWCQFVVYPMPEFDTTLADEAAQPGFNIVTVTPEQTYVRRHTFKI
jgi:Icc protein